jgi:isopentenyl-diphosphate delta-isomerase
MATENLCGENHSLNHKLFDSAFEVRKADHIRLALEARMQATGRSGLDKINLIHEALPDLDFKEVSLSTRLFEYELSAPLFISSMTAGHVGSVGLNLTLARAAENRGWAMGVGSQRRQLFDHAADGEWLKLRKASPKLMLFGNIGLAQVIQTTVDDIRRLADSLEAAAMIVHLNPLQECLQPEGTPRFKGGLKALERLVCELGRPVIVKETGCGLSSATLSRLKGVGFAAVDIGGLGGTHWGRIEGGRAGSDETLQRTAKTFRNWGIATVEALVAAVQLKPDYAVWASGGLRSGLDAAKTLAMGASMAGFAKPLIKAALSGEECLDREMAILEYELKTALFCTGAKDVATMREMKAWR